MRPTSVGGVAMAVSVSTSMVDRSVGRKVVRVEKEQEEAVSVMVAAEQVVVALVAVGPPSHVSQGVLA